MKPNRKAKVVAHSKPIPLIKCRLCGEVLKLTKWKKHLARFHNIGEDSRFRDYFCVLDNNIAKKSEVKCRLCGEIIRSSEWRFHLRFLHNISKSPRFHDFFIGKDMDTYTAQKRWYNSDSISARTIPCGTKINGGPKAKVIFNPVFSNKRKF